MASRRLHRAGKTAAGKAAMDQLEEVMRERDALKLKVVHLMMERDAALREAMEQRHHFALQTKPRRTAEACLAVARRGFFGLPSLWRLATVCSAFRALLGSSDARLIAVRWHGAPRPLRLRFWAHALGVRAVRAAASGLATTEALDRLGVELTPVELLELKASGTEAEIGRDVGRTFPYHPAFCNPCGEVCQHLERVLRCVAVHHPRVRYCQGMNFVVGLMILEVFGQIAQRSADGTPTVTPTGGSPTKKKMTGVATSLTASAVPSRMRGSPRRLSSPAPISAPSIVRRGDRALTRGSWFVARLDAADADADAGAAVVEAARCPMPLRLPYSSVLDRSDEAIRDVPTEERLLDITWIMRALIESSHTSMGGLWSIDLSGLQVALYQFRELLCKVLPKLAAHMRELDLRLDFLAGQWLAPLFGNILEWEAVLRVWDAFFLCGWPALFRIAVAILVLLEDKLLEMDVQQFTTFFRMQRDSERGVEIDIDQIFRVEADLHAKDLINQGDLADLAEQYKRNVLWQRLDDPLPHVLNVGEKSVTIETEGRDAVRLKMKVLDKSIAMEVVDFSTKIEEAKKLEASLSAVFIETSRIANDAQLLIEEHAMKKRSVMISLELINGQLGGGGATRGPPQLKARSQSAPLLSSFIANALGTAVSSPGRKRSSMSTAPGARARSDVEEGDFEFINVLQLRLNALAAKDEKLRGKLRETLTERHRAEREFRAKRGERSGLQAQLLLLQKSHERRVTQHMEWMFARIDEQRSRCPAPASRF